MLIFRWNNSSFNTEADPKLQNEFVFYLQMLFNRIEDSFLHLQDSNMFSSESLVQQIGYLS